MDCRAALAKTRGLWWLPYLHTPPMTPVTLPTGRHIVCFWKQNDLGLLGRRPDRWIARWAQDPTVEKVLVFEAPVANTLLQ
jgi:hypothetical protein